MRQSVKEAMMVAPILVPILTTAGSYLASKGMDLLGSIFKSSVDKGMNAVTKKLEQKTGIKIEDIADEKISEDDLIKLKQFELDYQEFLLSHLEKMKSLEIEEEVIHQKDRSSARQMQMVALVQEDKFAKRFIYGYSILITLLTFAFIFGITFTDAIAPNSPQKSIADTVLGFLLGVSLSAIIQFFYGSSKGSSDKASQLSTLTQQLADKTDELGGK